MGGRVLGAPPLDPPMQECIPVGCVPSTAVAICWGVFAWGVSACQGEWLLRGVSASQGVCPGRGFCLPGTGVSSKGVSAWESVCARGYLPREGVNLPPPWTVRHLWKDNLSATTVADGNNFISFFNSHYYMYSACGATLMLLWWKGGWLWDRCGLSTVGQHTLESTT